MHSVFHFHYVPLKEIISWIFILGPISIHCNQSNLKKYQASYEYPFSYASEMLNGYIRIWMLCCSTYGNCHQCGKNTPAYKL